MNCLLSGAYAKARIIFPFFKRSMSLKGMKFEVVEMIQKNDVFPGALKGAPRLTMKQVGLMRILGEGRLKGYEVCKGNKRNSFSKKEKNFIKNHKLVLYWKTRPCLIVILKNSTSGVVGSKRAKGLSYHARNLLRNLYLHSTDKTIKRSPFGFY